MRWVHPFDLVALISNVGIYLGLFVGFLLQWQGAEFFIAVLATVRGLISRKPKVIEEIKEGKEDMTEKDDNDDVQEELSDKMEEKDDLDIKKIHFLKLDGEETEDATGTIPDEEKEKTE